ncbi:MAG: hypothetical protein FJ290_25470, partial [Planctomycetes bacterium]|nr:hypothetical protein [Planctomycetota bacterium]
MAQPRTRPLRRRHSIIAIAILAAIVVLAGLYVAIRFLRHWALERGLAAAAKAVEGHPDPMVRRDLKAHLAYLRARLGQMRKRDILFGRLGSEGAQLRRACVRHKPNPHLRPGHHVIVTVSAIDGAELPTSVDVPRGWDASSPLPLVLDLHAAGVRKMTDCFPVRPYPGGLCMTPLARGSHDYMGAQMAAVEECLADVRRRYPVSRLYVLGHSMGGTGTWLFAIRHVGELSGAAPWMGNADPDAWKGVWEEEERPILSPAGRACELAQRARMPVARVGQLAGRPDMPLYVGHGAADTIVPVGHSDSMAEKLRALGAKNLRYDRFEGIGHGGFPVSRDEQLAWLLAHPPSEPAEFTAIIPPLTFVADMAGAPPHRVLDPLKEAKLIIRGGKFADGENVEAATDAAPSKWHYPGPAGFAFESPFTIALPQGAPEHLARCADELSTTWKERWGGTVPPHTGWKPVPPPSQNGGTGVPPVAPPRTLIALGSPQENPAVKAALDPPDVFVAHGVVRLCGREFRGDDIGVILLRPGSPAALVVCGSTPDAYRQLWGRLGHVVHLEGDRGRWYFD